ncbi:hypothetical protein B0G71_3394 [Paraburkholderia sp. BL27I4N3]|nr:hypothetical protein B0G71_3394 [Paraburkholderia sp. BL27I4N3]RKR43063.1 hypothetical protein B0G82_0613 [Paraburkholderia sp. BL17N1]
MKSGVANFVTPFFLVLVNLVNITIGREPFTRLDDAQVTARGASGVSGVG